jgi:hypothetical protein
MEEKKLYPSQINTKTISLRLPLTEYAKILNESLQMGVSMSDYLILKIYNNSQIGNEKLPNEQPNENDYLNFTITKNYFKNVYNECFYYPDEKDDNGTPFNEFWNEFSKDLKHLVGIDFDIDTEIVQIEKNLEDFKEYYIGQLINSHRRQLNVNYFYKLSQNAIKREASLIDVKTQLTVIIKRKFPLLKEQKEFRKELFELLNELD